MRSGYRSPRASPRRSCCRWRSPDSAWSQRLSLSPRGYQSDPMSAAKSPLVCIPLATIFPGPLKLDVSVVTFSPSLRPVGGSALPSAAVPVPLVVRPPVPVPIPVPPWAPLPTSARPPSVLPLPDVDPQATTGREPSTLIHTERHMMNDLAGSRSVKHPTCELCAAAAPSLALKRLGAPSLWVRIAALAGDSSTPARVGSGAVAALEKTTAAVAGRAAAYLERRAGRRHAGRAALSRGPAPAARLVDRARAAIELTAAPIPGGAAAKPECRARCRGA